VSGDAAEAPPWGNRYRILEERARGAYGIIYRARDLEIGRDVALKALRRPSAGPVARERFLREARTAARLRHPNIVRVFAWGEHEGVPFYTMELLEGPALAGPVPPVQACRLMAKVALAAACAHAAGVVHRDLKPGNIVLHEDEPVLTDFGASRAEGDVRMTETGDLLGTPAYMSPEQIGGRAREAGPKADVYAMGAILYELLTGRLPFEGATFLELSGQILNDPPPALPGFDPALEELVHRCLAKDPAARPEARELARALERWAPGRRPRWAAILALLAVAGIAAVWGASSPAAEPDFRGDMARIPGGEYLVGDPRFGRRAVILPDFWIDRDEAPARASGWSYLEALSWCLRQGKRLPSEDEWEVAGGGRLFPWGDEPDPSRAACQGSREPNPRDVSRHGVRGLAGHRAEWTATPGPAGPDYRVARGGHWASPIEGCTLFARQELPVTRRLPTLGFRCASDGAPDRH
jgi:formylglycine-generating enzyme required for sulfatase activity